MTGRALSVMAILSLLAACGREDIAFCESYLSAGHSANVSYERVDLRIESRPLAPLEAQQLVFPNYRPNAYFPHRPGKTSFILDALESFPATLREIHIDYAVKQGENRRRVSGTCRFLVLGGNPQFVSNLHLHDLLIRKALSGAAQPTDCCIRTNEKVR